MTKSIAVFGGNGFLGRKICEVGINRGYNITSYSRSGQPPQSPHHQSPPATWISQVSWQKCDIFNPRESIPPHKLGQFDTIVHSIGLLFEDASYKKSMNSNFGVLQDVQKLANRVLGSGVNPMQKDKVNSSYEAVQRDSAVLIADEYIEARLDALKEEEEKKKKKKNKNSNSADSPTGAIVGNYVYISADQNPPIVPQRYIITKREAEFELSNKPHLRSILMRPGIMYEEKTGDTNEQHFSNRDVLVKGLKLGVSLKNAVLGEQFLSGVVRPVVSTTQVANAIFDKLEDGHFKGGVVPVEEIEQKSHF
ncbi:hypothetical protein KGF57_004159 [Candida theae]|uniref:NAD-dependent epimerase/dehydratase domain-containing protein n=1 Tax=Candida theae TaxID=1198502 RepID=A0AAD5BC74_9ASCO|nr:uncharacterized protein KGF57_004159 [Candida theae]KAI5952154.1 hypothetical protein KGF57_004159 [Candida theae]